MSDWISFAAAGIALAALIAGEVRAFRARKLQTERTAVQWEFSWPSPNTLRMTNGGPDTAHAVLVRVTANYVRASAKAKRLSEGQHVDIPADWTTAWGSIDDGYANQGGLIIIGPFSKSFGADIYWSSKRGTPDSKHLDTSVERAIDVRQ